MAGKSSVSQAADRALCRVLNGTMPHDGGVTWEDVKQRANMHGVLGLLHQMETERPLVSPRVLHEIETDVVASVMWEEHHKRMLTNVLERFEQARVPALLFKGTALAYSCYAQPHHRMRGDTDVLVPADRAEEACEILHDLDLVADDNQRNSILTSALSHCFYDPTGARHELDLHWRVNNAIVLGSLFTFEELEGRSVQITKLHPSAREIGLSDALLVACFHRQVHATSPYYVDGQAYKDQGRLIWLYDIHLLTLAMGDFDWSLALRLAQDKGLLEICGAGLAATCRAFGSNAPSHVTDACKRQKPLERPARYLASRQAGQLWMNYCAVSGAQKRARYLQELLFPSETHMRAQFEHLAVQWLPWLYVRRFVGGLRKIMTRP